MYLEISGYVHKGGDESKTAKVRGAMWNQLSVTPASYLPNLWGPLSTSLVAFRCAPVCPLPPLGP